MAYNASTSAETCQERGIHPEDVARARAGLEDDRVYIELAELFGALADATLVTIVHTLLRQELCTCYIAAVAESASPAPHSTCACCARSGW